MCFYNKLHRHVLILCRLIIEQLLSPSHILFDDLKTYIILYICSNMMLKPLWWCCILMQLLLFLYSYGKCSSLTYDVIFENSTMLIGEWRRPTERMSQWFLGAFQHTFCYDFPVFFHRETLLPEGSLPANWLLWLSGCLWRSYFWGGYFHQSYAFQYETFN